jgi:hypothetical protein
MEDAYLRKVAEAAIKVKSIANHEFIRHIKANEFALC